MKLTREEKQMLEGKQGPATKKAMEILVALGEIYGAKRMVPVSSVQVSGVSYHNLGDAGLEFLDELARGGGRVRVLTTLNPAGMDLLEWQKLGISEEFAHKQLKVIDAFRKMGIVISCTCTPYLAGNLPHFGESVAWGESSAVCFVNSVVGAKTNREGGPSALAAALTGRTPEYGMHLDGNRKAQVLVEVKGRVAETPDFGALGKAIGEKIGNKIPLIKGVKKASTEQLKSFSASIATYGGTALFYMKGITPGKTPVPKEKILITQEDLDKAMASMRDEADEVDLVSVGCPHCSIKEIEDIARALAGKKVKAEFWICTSRVTKTMADSMGFTKTIEETGAKVAADTCMVVAPIKGRFKVMATDSGKACFYGRGTNKFKVKIGTLEQCIAAALSGKWVWGVDAHEH